MRHIIICHVVQQLNEGNVYKHLYFSNPFLSSPSFSKSIDSGSGAFEMMASEKKKQLGLFRVIIKEYLEI